MTDVAITGVGAVTALGRGVEALESGLARGQTAVVPHLDYREPAPFPVAGVALPTDPKTDRARVLARYAVEEAVEAAGWAPKTTRSSTTMLVVASTKAGLNVAQRVLEKTVDPVHLPQSFLFALAPRLAEELAMVGPVHTVSLACASGLVAVGLARQAILRNEVDRAVVVGTDALCRFIYRGFASLQALDPNGARPFDARRAGLSVGEGAAAVTLERGAGLARVCGYGASNDANHITGPARDGRGLIRALEGALVEADVTRSEVGFGLLHGTGTKFNDAMEGVAYGQVFGPRGLPVLSIKGAIGHTMGAAGLANLVVTVRSLQSGQIPPNAGAEVIDPEIPLDVVQNGPRPIDTRWAVTTASGFAGVNAAVVVSAAPRPSRPARPAALTRGRGAVAAPGDDVRAQADDAVLTVQVCLPPERAAAVDQIGARSARRLDDLCLLGVAAADAVFEKSGLTEAQRRSAAHGLVLGTAAGCLESDYGFYIRELRPDAYDPSPRLFAYTLPNIVLGETAIRTGLMGENVVLSAGRASGLAALVEASHRIRAASWDYALVLAVDAVGPALAQVAPDGARGLSFGWLVERRAYAEARGATVYGTLYGQMGSQPVTDLRRPAIVRPADAGDDGEPLGGAGVDGLRALVEAGRSGQISVACPSGYTASIVYEGLRSTEG